MSKKKRVSLRDKYKQDYDNKDSGNSNSKRVLDLSGYEEVDFYKMKEKENEIDIIPFLVTSNNHPLSKANGGDLIPGESYDYVLDVWVHRFIGPGSHNFLCMKKTYGKTCVICDEIEKMLSAEMITEKQEKVIKAKRRVFYNIIDIQEEDKGIQIFEVSHFEFQKEIIELSENPGKRFKGINEDGYVPFADLDEGCSIIFKGTKRKFEKRESIKPGNFSFWAREEEYDEEILDEVYPLDSMLIVSEDQDEVRRLMLDEDIEEDENNNEEEVEEEQPRTRKKKVREKTTRKSRRKRQENKEEEGKEKDDDVKTECPHGYIFGVDCEEKDECKECDKWEDCAEEQDRLNEEEDE